MKLKQLVEQLNALVDAHGEDEVVVRLNMPSIGYHATTPVDNFNVGFDWDMGKIMFNTRDRITTKTQKEDIWDMSYDFLYTLAAHDRLRRMGKTYKTSYATRAESILQRAGITIEEDSNNASS